MKQVIKTEIVKDIDTQNLPILNVSLSGEELGQLRKLFEARYDTPDIEWPRNILKTGIECNTFEGRFLGNAPKKAKIDCEGLAHYITKGIVNKFEKADATNVKKIDIHLNEHKPYTCYKIWVPLMPMQEDTWTPIHYFTHLENGKYLSKNGAYAATIFDSYQEMLKNDAFPYGYVSVHSKTDDIEQAVIGESEVCTIHE